MQNKISTLDLIQGFHQIRVAPEHIHRTAFQTGFDSYEFVVMQHTDVRYSGYLLPSPQLWCGQCRAVIP